VAASLLKIQRSINLSSAGGGVDAVNIRASILETLFEVGTVSGDIRLDKVNNTKVVAKTVNGNVMMTDHWPMVTLCVYHNVRDVTLTLPPDAVISTECKDIANRDIESDFPLTFTQILARPCAANNPQAVCDHRAYRAACNVHQ